MRILLTWLMLLVWMKINWHRLELKRSRNVYQLTIICSVYSNALFSKACLFLICVAHSVEHWFKDDIAKIFLKELRMNRNLMFLRIGMRRREEYASKYMNRALKYMEQNRRKPKQVTDTLLSHHHSLRHPFLRQKIVCLGDIKSGKTSTFENLLANTAPTSRNFIYRPTDVLNFFEMTNLTETFLTKIFLFSSKLIKL